jgi:hypothetical protein
MPDFNELFIEAHQVLDKARMLNDNSKRNGVDFVIRELDLSMALAESGLASSQRVPRQSEAKRIGCENCVSGCPKVFTKTRSPWERPRTDRREIGKTDSLIEMLSGIK